MSVEKIKELFSKRTSDAESLKTCIVASVSAKPPRNPEFEAGITEYLNKSEGFSAVIKERYSDFQVNEIDLDGNIVKLTNFDIPVVEEASIEDSDDVLDEKSWEQLEELKEKKITCVEIDVTDIDKDGRRSIHKVIKRKYDKLFTTNTVCKDGDKKFMVISINKNPREGWNNECDYLHFVLHKTNIDTLQAVNTVANMLSTKASNITYAGNKDKRGKTSQQVCMWHLKPERLRSLNKGLRNMKVGNFSYKKNTLKLGDLKGNHFKIALRNVTVDDDTINKALLSLKDNGFINYYGLQRFGNSLDVPTYKIGKSLLKDDYKQAVELILKPREGKLEKDRLELAKRIWWDTRDAKKAFEVLKQKCRTHEGKLIYGLKEHGANNFVNALEEMPRNMRLLYLHSYQSLLWNKIVSKRIKEFGCKVLEGDLIMVKGESSCESNKGSAVEDTENTDEVSEDVLKEAIVNKGTVKHITAEEVDKYTILDIVHPLPGYNIIYPNNIIKIWYEELLKEEDLSEDGFKQQRVKGYRISGAYRNIVQTVKDLTWEIVYYSNPEQDLILSDLDIMENDLSNYGVKESGEFKAVIINFSLDSSTYATMALREVLKINTSSSYQASLNSYSMKRKTDDGDNDEDIKKKVKL